MEATVKTLRQLEAELAEARRQLEEANDTIEAIRTGQVDALVVQGEQGHELYTLKSADIAYRVFIENMTEGAVTLNRDGIILYCNSQFATMLGLPLSQVMGLPLVTFIPDDDAGVFRSAFNRCWTKACKEELSLQTAKGLLPVQFSITTMELEEGPSLSVIITDLSPQKKTQQQLLEKARQLEEMNYALETSNHDLQQFASVASHDLQEPLRKIQLFANLLKERTTGLAEDPRRYVDKIFASAGRMKTLIVDVLGYSKLSAADDEFVPVDLREVAMEVVEDFDLLIGDKDATVRVDNLPVIEGKRGQLRQVFQNLVSNGLKFTRDGERPVIHISARRLTQKTFHAPEQSDGAFCLLSVKDNGIGFDEKYTANVFALFERLHAKDQYEGSGIGMAITKKIVEKHNGLVTAKSKTGEGAEFLLLLPIQQ